MADDPRLTQAYRSLPAEEPPPALDDAIRAAARRAVSARPRSSRWQVPVSIAAVLVLAFGIALQLEREKPILDDAPPAALQVKPETAPAANRETSAPAATPAPATSREAPPVTMRDAAPLGATAKPVPSEAAPPPREKKSVPSPVAPPAEAPQPSFAPSPPPAADAARSAPSAPSPAQNVQPAAPSTAASRTPAPAAASSPPAAASSPSPAPASAPSPSPAAASAPVPKLQAPGSAPAADAAFAPDPGVRRAEPLRAAPGVSGVAKEEAAGMAAPSEKRRAREAESPERWLERIAELRRQGRDAEADAEWEAFRRAHPAHRVAPETLERIRAR